VRSQNHNFFEIAEDAGSAETDPKLFITRSLGVSPRPLRLLSEEFYASSLEITKIIRYMVI